jgi:hypothetical protein
VTPRVCAVLRTGGEYRIEHAQRLAAQVARFAPGAEFFVLSNVEVPGVQTLLCEHHYKGWWQKIEMMKPSIRGNLLMFDLDTTIVGLLDDMLARTALTMTADFYSLRKLQSPVMFLTEEARARVWEEWCRIGPAGARLAHTGDGQFMHAVFGGKADTWQSVLPGQVVSYKIHVQLDPKKGKHIGNGFVPPGARVVCFHGQPRPWHVPELRFQ